MVVGVAQISLAIGPLKWVRDGWFLGYHGMGKKPSTPVPAIKEEWSGGEEEAKAGSAPLRPKGGGGEDEASTWLQANYYNPKDA